jgi:hypothetical protein
VGDRAPLWARFNRAAAVAELLVHSTPRKSDEEVKGLYPPLKMAEKRKNDIFVERFLQGMYLQNFLQSTYNHSNAIWSINYTRIA